jgi:hypothetical protein
MNKIPVNLNSTFFKMPSLLRTTVSIDKRINTQWSTSFELMYNKNMEEIKYTNINLVTPIEKVLGPDKRFVYPQLNNGRTPLLADGTNPYDYVVLFSNNLAEKGYAYSATLTVSRQTHNDVNFELGYSFTHSSISHEGTSSINISQWRLMETVNGRNYPVQSESDFSGGHRIFFWGSKTFHLFKRNMPTTFSITYNGQSGAPFSYVYENSLTRDDGFFGGYDLIYIPTKKELNEMIFLPNPVNGMIYGIDQQKEAFDLFIEKDNYLNKRRGYYVERNGSRTPFTHIIDVKIKQDCKLSMGKRVINLKLFFDIFNITNLLNGNWGRQYYQPSNQIALLTFAGYISETNLVPQYRFNPELLNTPPWIVSTSLSPGYSARWSGQIGIKINL